MTPRSGGKMTAMLGLSGRNMEIETLSMDGKWIISLRKTMAAATKIVICERYGGKTMYRRERED